MKQTTFTFLLFAAIALISCRKDKYDTTINEYDDQQIKEYISANGITGMTRDTSGMYFKIINPGTGAAIQYSDNISLVFTVRSLDGKYVTNDTLINHFNGYAGHLVGTTYPLGLNVAGFQSAIHNILNHEGGIMRIIIPSRLAYGVGGAGTGSSSVTAGRIAGNQCLDYYVHIIGKQGAGDPYGHLTALQDAYDQLIIKDYITRSNLTSVMQHDASGIWYQIRTPATGNVAITNNSTIGATYTVSLLDGTITDEYNQDGGTRFDIPDVIKGVQIGLKKYGAAGALMTFLIPSSLAYANVGNTIPQNSCIKYEVQVISVGP